MTMDSWFSDPSGGNGEDTSALWAQEEADKKKREEEYQAGPLPGQGLPPPPSGAAMFGPGAQNFSNYPPVTAPPIGDLISQPPPLPTNPPNIVGQYVGQGFGPMNPVDTTGQMAGQYIGQAFGPMSPPPAPPPVGINPIQGGFRGPENPANLEPGPNADYGVFTPFHPLNTALFNPDNGVLTPYLDPARTFAGNVGGLAGQLADPLGIGNYASGQFGGPSPEQVGRFAGQGMIGNSIEDFGLNALMAPKGASLLERFTGLPLSEIGGNAVRSAEDIARVGMPEPNLVPGLGSGPNPYNFDQWTQEAARQAGTPAETFWRQGERGGQPAFGPGSRGGMPNDTAFADAVRANQNLSVEDQLRASLEPGPIDLQTAQMGPQGRVPSAAEIEAARMDAEFNQMFPSASATPPAPPPAPAYTGDIAHNDLQAFERGRAEMRALETGGDSAPEETVRLYRGETTPGTGGPLPEWIQQGRAQTGMADASGRWFTDDPAKADWYLKEAGEGGRLSYIDVPKSQADALRVTNNADVAKYSLDPQSEYFVPREMADARQPLTGGGSAPVPPPAEGQVVRIAVQPDALRPLEDFIAPGKGFEITDPSKARILSPGENVGPGETLMLHGTGNAGIQGDLRAGINVTNDPVVANSVARTESRLEGMNLPSADAAPPPASPPNVPPGGAGQIPPGGTGPTGVPPAPPATPPNTPTPPPGPPPITPPAAVPGGAPQSLIDKVIEEAKRSQEAVYNVYTSPQGAGRVTAAVEALGHAAEGAVSGDLPDSFINVMINERTALTNALEKAGANEAQIGAAVGNHLNELVERHYPGNAVKQADAFTKLAANETRATELAKDWNLFTATNNAIKNTVASVGDFAVLGINGLVEIAQAGPYAALGTLNRAANSIATVLHHPTLLDYERVTGLPNLIGKELHGLPFNYGGEGFRTGKDAPTLLGLGGKWNPASPIDKHVIQPVINANNKLQFDMIQGWAKNSISDGLLTQEYVRKFAEGMIANKGNLGKANDFAMQYVSRPDVLRDITRFTRNATGSTAKALAPGRQTAENLSLFSAAFTRGQFARPADIAKLLAPGASETQRVLAASALFSTMAFSAGIYKFANDKFGTTDAQMDPTKPGYGRIVLPGGQVVSMAPQSSIRNAFVNSMEAIRKGNPEDIKGILAQTAISRLSPLFSDAVRGYGYGYDTKGNFYSPFKNEGEKMPTDERIKGAIPVPFTAQGPAFNGQPVFSTATGLNVAGFNPYQEKASTEAFRERADKAQVQTQALVNGDLLRSSFPENPTIAAALQGREWNALGYYEQQAILGKLDPEARKQVEEANAANAKANKEQPTAIGNAVEIRNREKAAEDKVMQESQGAFKTLESALTDGQHDPYKVRLAISEAEKAMRQDITLERWKGGTTYTGLPWPERAGPEHIAGDLQSALNAWYNIGDNLPRDAKGSINFDALNSMKAAYLQELRKDDPQTFERLSFHIQQAEQEAEAKKPDVLKFYDQIQATSLRDYYANPEGTRTQWAREHPTDNAKLWVAGYIPYLYTPSAIAVAHELAPHRQPVTR